MINYCKTLLSGQGADLRLKNGATNVQSFTYDATGNRLSKTLATTTTSSTYPATSHRLSNDGTSARTYDANGNTATLAAKSFVYDDRNRLRDYINSGTTVTRTYRYNDVQDVQVPRRAGRPRAAGKGERVSKVQSATSTNNRYYFYDEAGHLLGEYLANGTRVQEYVWLDDQLIGVLSDHDTSTYQFVETDHLGTPRAVIHPAQNKIIWRWNITNTAFGEHAATNDPDANTITYTFNHRYPGQQANAESGLNYNYRRDGYEPQTGRYTQSDPLGIFAGASTYGYVDSNPIAYTDPSGLIKWTGEIYSFEVGYGGAAGAYNFDLKSDCVDGKYAYVHVYAIGGGIGIGAKGSIPVAAGPVEFKDGNTTIDPNVFNGKFQIFSFGGGVIMGGGISYIQLGDAIAELDAEKAIAFGISAVALIGSSRLYLGPPEIKDCKCESK
jgi:RHS repeat-associated protein